MLMIRPPSSSPALLPALALSLRRQISPLPSRGPSLSCNTRPPPFTLGQDLLPPSDKFRSHCLAAVLRQSKPRWPTDLSPLLSLIGALPFALTSLLDLLTNPSITDASSRSCSLRGCEQLRTDSHREPLPWLTPHRPSSPRPHRTQACRLRRIPPQTKLRPAPSDPNRCLASTVGLLHRQPSKTPAACDLAADSARASLSSCFTSLSSSNAAAHVILLRWPDDSYATATCSIAIKPRPSLA